MVWCECLTATTLYRFVDVLGQVGKPAFFAHNGGYLGGMIAGLAVAHTVSPGAGAGLGFGLYVAGVVTSLFLARDPDSVPPRFWSKNKYMARLWWMAFYSVRIFVPPHVVTHARVEFSSLLQGRATPLRSECYSRNRQKLGYPGHLATRAPLHRRSNARHRLHFRIRHILSQ